VSSDRSSSELLNLRQAAALMGISLNAMRKAVDDKEVAHVTVGRRRLLSPSFLRTAVSRPSNRIDSTTDVDLHELIRKYENREARAIAAGACKLDDIPEDLDDPAWEELSPTEPGSEPPLEDVRLIAGLPFFELAEVMRRSGLGRSSIMQAFKEGELAAKKLAGTWVVSPIWLEDFLTTPSGGPFDPKDANEQARFIRRVLAREAIERARKAAKGD
jgi:predicted DNA-binding transcriptional regulator AlpA